MVGLADAGKHSAIAARAVRVFMARSSQWVALIRYRVTTKIEARVHDGSERLSRFQ